ncbi:MAG: fibrobacter succinogenes major paralogous domain-containing protein [Bacteroidia bacterium]
MKLALTSIFFIAAITLQAQTVTIGTQVWMTKNLDVTIFRNGDPISQAKTNEEWEKAWKNEQPAWCYYDNDPKNGEKYGKLYNWYAVNDPRGLAPVGYHIPSDAEWGKLVDYLGGEEKAGAKMKSKTGWNEDGNGTNSSGFSGLPGGYRGYNGAFLNVGLYGNWWSSSEVITKFARYRSLIYGNGPVYRLDGNKGGGFSVRCLRD